MSKRIYVHLSISGINDLGTTYADHLLSDNLTVSGQYVTHKYLLVDSFTSSQFHYYDYELSIDGESTSISISQSAEKLYYTDPGSGQKSISAWQSVTVDDSYVIPTALDRSGLFGYFQFSAAANTAIDWNGYKLDIGSYNSTSGTSINDLVTAATNSGPTILGNYLTQSGFPGYGTALQNIQIVHDTLSSTMSSGINIIAMSSSGSTDQQLSAALSSFDNIVLNNQHALSSAVLIPNNTTADALLHSELIGFGFVGNGAAPTAGVATLSFEIALPGGAKLATDINATSGYAVSPEIGNYELDGNSASNYLFGGDGDNIIRAIGTNNHLFGGGGNDTIYLDDKTNYVQGGLGNDTVVLSGSIHSYSGHLISNTNAIISTGNGMNSDLITNVEDVRFSDGIVDLSTTTPLIDPFWYDAKYSDVLAAGVSTSLHYDSNGWKEGRDPNPYFSTSGYLNTNKDVKAAAIDPLTHYDQSGWKEGRDPSANFDTTLYLLHNPDVAAAGIDPLTHFLQAGQAEGRSSYAAIGSIIKADGFDAEYYLLSNPDVAASGIDPYQHYITYGWKDGRNPNAWFDDKGYISHYGSLMAPGLNPLDDYNQYGWKQGRDPSESFDTTLYLSQNPDVAAANINPLYQYLQNGAYESRALLSSNHPWQVSAQPITVGSPSGGPLAVGGIDHFLIYLQGGERYSVNVANPGNYSVTIKDPYSDSASSTLLGVSSDPLGSFNASFGYTAVRSGYYAVDVANASKSANDGFALTFADVTTQFPSAGNYKESADYGGTAATAFDLGGGYKSQHDWHITGSLTAKDHDFFSFSTDGGNIDFRVANTNGGSTITGHVDGVDLTLTDSLGHIVAASVGGIDNGTPFQANLSAGTYFVDVHTYQGAPTLYALDIYL